MAVQADYNTLAQKVYVAYFGRPADALGLSNMTAQLLAAAVPVTGVPAADTTAFVNAYSTNATIKSIIDNFGTSTESLALYGSSTTSNATFVNSIYLNVLGRSPLLAGLTFWSNALTTGAMTRGEAALRIMEGALTNTTAQGLLDGATVANKVTAAQTFTDNQLTVADVLGYSGSAAAATARTWLSTITSDAATLTAATATVATTITSINTATAAAAAVGTTFTLTSAADTTMVGGTANDTFAGTLAANLGTGTTLNAGDVLAGGAGTDTLSISISGTNTGAQTTSAVTMTGIENISVSNFQTSSGANNNTMDLSLATGVSKISLAASSSTAGGDTAFIGVGAIVTAEMGNGANDLSITYTNTAVAGAADAQTLTLSGQTGGAFTVAPTSGTNDIESLAIASNTAANTIAVTSASLTSITVTGTQNLTLTEGTTTLATVNAGALTGNLTLTTNDATSMSITGGTGNDAITLGGFTAADSVDGGSGTDSLSIDVAVASAAALANVTGIETLKVTGGANITLAANVVPTTFTVSDATASIVTLNTGYTAATTVNLGVTDSVLNTAGVALTINATATNMMSGADISITGGTGTDTLNLTADLDAAAGGFTAVTLAQVSSLNAITIVDGGNDASTGTNPAGDDVAITIGAAYATSLTVDASALDAGTLTGTTMDANWENLNFDATAQSTAATVLNVTGGAGADTIQGGAGNDIIAGGAGNDSINGSAGGADSITAGDADDTINMAGALTSADTIDGGSGTDTLSVTSLSASGLTNVTNVETLSLSGASSSATLTANLSFTTIDMSTVDNAAQILTLSTGYTNATAVSVDATDKVVNTANVALTVNATAADLVAANVTITGGTGADVFNITADTNAQAAIALTNVTAVDTITIVDGGNDASTGTNPAGDDVSITTGAYATALTINGSAMAAGTLTGTTMNADWENLTVDGTSATKNLTITTGSGANTITGGLGNDSITAGSGNDSINGSAGGNDTIITGDGTNTINMGTGLTYQDTITGGAGTDTLIVSGAVTDVQFMATTLVNTLTLDNTATLASFAQTAGITKVNVSGANAVDGSGMTSGVNFVAGSGAGNSSIAGGTGNDTFTFAGTTLLDATDMVNGGSGTADTLSLDNSAGAMTATVALTTALVRNVENYTVLNANGGDTAGAENADAVSLTFDSTSSSTVAVVSTVSGAVITDSNDAFTADASGVTDTDFTFNITGGAGNDVLKGGAAADTISGGAGLDTITGSAGADNMTGGADADTFAYALASSQSTVAAADTITDFVTGTDKIAFTYTLAASGTIDATNKGTAATNADGLALLSSKIGQYYFNTGTSQMIMDVDANGLIQATDLAIAMTGMTSVGAGDVNFTITSTTGGNTIETITTGGGADSITAGDNADLISTGAGNDVITVALAADLASGESILGGTGTDTLVFAEAAGYNLTNLHANTDNLVGEAGIEQLVVVNGQTTTMDEAIDGNALAINSVAAGNVVLAFGTLTDSAVTLANLTFSAFSYGSSTGVALGNDDNDYVTVTMANAAGSLIGSSLKDSITGGNNADNINGGAGNDTIVMGANLTVADVITGGLGTDTMTITDDAAGADTELDNVTGVEVITATGTGASSFVLSAAKTLIAAGEALSFTNAAGQNMVLDLTNNTTTGTLTYVGNSALDSVYGGSGADTIGGAAGADSLVGGAGNDQITGGASAVAADTMTGGTGADKFIFASGAEALGAAAGTDTTAALVDRITDFAIGTDTIQLGLTANQFGTAVTFTAGTTVTLDGTYTNNADRADFAALATAAAAALTEVATSSAAMHAFLVVTGAEITTATGFASKTYLVINDDTTAIAATDAWIDITGYSGTLASIGSSIIFG